jgi:hypothetical protein
VKIETDDWRRQTTAMILPRSAAQAEANAGED